MNNLRYSIGPYQAKKEPTPRDVTQWIDEIKIFPENLSNEISPLSDEQLKTPYRADGWSLQQVVHHIADSHLNGYTRMKLALTEDSPTIKPYDQESWAELPDMAIPVDSSLKIIQGLHQRWAYLLSSLDEAQLNRPLVHPESGTSILKSLIELYAWHGKHHLGHITSLKERKNWD